MPAVFRTEGQALSFIKARVAKGTTVHADASPNWDDLHAAFEMKRINHDVAYSLDSACTNEAENTSHAPAALKPGTITISPAPTISPLRSGSHLREDNHRVSNGDQLRRLAKLATMKETSVHFVGYWQRYRSV